MTRPGFLVITPVACALGVAITVWQGAIFSFWVAGVATCAAVLMHAAANVLNDYHDAQSGADEANTQGLFPFTGGARLIQNGEVSVEQTRAWAYALAVGAALLGVWLTWQVGEVVVTLGVLGLFLGWSYSAEPLRLMSRGLGELSVGLAWALMVWGSAAVCQTDWSLAAGLAALGYGAWVTNILLINGFPDAPADAAVGKRTAVVRAGPRLAAQIYIGSAAASYVLLIGAILGEVLPPEAAWAALSLPTACLGAIELWRHAHEPQQLRPAVMCTIISTLIYGLGMTAGLLSAA